MAENIFLKNLTQPSHFPLPPSLSSNDFPIPKTINFFIFAIATSMSIFFLVMASRVHALWAICLAMIGFGLVNQTCFSLLHEAVHQSLHPNAKINRILGIILAGFFPTGFGFQQVCHLGHHRRNRTDAENFEVYYLNDSRFWRTMTLLSTLNGLYWTNPPLGALLFLFCPNFLINGFFRGKGNSARIIKRLGADAMITPLEKIPKHRLNQMRLEILYSLAFQILIFWLLDLSFWRWILCYYTFGILWASLQYTDHAFSPIHIRFGAWNLKVNPVIKAIYLNYFEHQTHHVYPHIPWIYLPTLIHLHQFRPTFWQIYRRLWRGPVALKKRIVADRLDGELDQLTRIDFQSPPSSK